MLKAEKLNKYFNRHKRNEIHVINDTTLEFEDTGLVCILGESGSGKTTLLNTIGGLDDFTSGVITVDDMKFDKYKTSKVEKLRNKKFGYIFQNYYLLQDYSVEYNIRLALEIFDLDDKETDERIDYVLEAVDMQKYKKRLVCELSGGQQQRVAIARALTKAPDVIFADEPTGNLDETNTMRIMSIIRKISAKCLVILVTHEQRIAEFFADRIIKVSDGKVVCDYFNKKTGTYSVEDDTNIYLKELECSKSSVDNTEINYYSDETGEKFCLNIVVKEGKLYIHSEDNRVVFLTNDSETKLVDDVRPQISMDSVDEFQYNLEPVQIKKTPRLSFKELCAMALANVRLLSKKQIFMFVAFIATAVMIVISVSDYYSVIFAEPSGIVSDDSHYITVSIGNNGYIPLGELYDSYTGAITAFYQSGIDGKIYPSKKSYLNIVEDNFIQLKKTPFIIRDFAYTDIDYIDEDKITIGSMPKDETEIVIDISLVNKIMDSNSVLASFIKKPGDVIGKTLELNSDGKCYTVSGVCDSGELSLYMDKKQLFSICFPSEYVAGKIYGDEYSGSDLIIWDEIVTDIDDEDYEDYVIQCCLYNREVKIYSDNPKAVEDFFSDYINEGTDTYATFIDVTNSYQESINEYKESRNMTTRGMVTCAVLIISLIVVFFTMKSNAIQRTQELVVYRLIGIAPGSIALSYTIELGLITTLTQVPAMLVTYGVLKYLTDVASFGFATICPWYVLIASMIAVYIVNIPVGLLPILSILRLPPAGLAAKN